MRFFPPSNENEKVFATAAINDFLIHSLRRLSVRAQKLLLREKYKAFHNSERDIKRNSIGALQLLFARVF